MRSHGNGIPKQKGTFRKMKETTRGKADYNFDKHQAQEKWMERREQKLIGSTFER